MAISLSKPKLSIRIFWIALLAILSVSDSGLSAIQPLPSGTVEIALSAKPTVRIDPAIFGVNYVWHLTPASRFSEFARAMREDIGATLFRYPGGWAAEAYDWNNNSYDLGQGRNAALPKLDRLELAENPGVSPEAFLSLVPRASFVTPSVAAIRNPASITATAQEAARLVRVYGRKVKIWEIGNEWWLQRGAAHDPVTRAQNLERYAALVRAAAPAMKSTDPSIAVFVTGDWVDPEEFSTLRRMVGERAWRSVDGSSIHPYCGDIDPNTLCGLLVGRAERIRILTGKDQIYASEWSLGRRVSHNDFGIRSASLMVSVLRAMAEARIGAAAYWPAVRGVPEIALISADYDHLNATGRLFGWMAHYFRGAVLDSSGPLPSAAARQGQEVSVFVATMEGGFNRLRIPLAATGLSGVVAAEAMFSDRPDDPNLSRLVRVRPLPTRVLQTAHSGRVVECDLATGAPHGDARWQIVRITLH